MDTLDLNAIRIGVTIVSLALFLALVAHAWSRRRAGEHAEAAMLPFVHEPAAGRAAEEGASR